MTTWILAVVLGMSAQVPAVPQGAAPARDLSTLVERVVRIAELQRQKLALEQELAGLGLGENHPEVLNLRAELSAVETTIRREGFQSYQTDVQQLTDLRTQLEGELAIRSRVIGPAHPEIQRLRTQIANLRERQRIAAVAQLSGGMEADLRAAIAHNPDVISPYLDLASLLVMAERPADAEAVLTQALAALKRGGKTLQLQ